MTMRPFRTPAPRRNDSTPLRPAAHQGFRRGRSLLVRGAATVAVIGLVAGSSACGFQPSRKSASPGGTDTAIRADGVNADIGSGAEKVMVRDLVVVSAHRGSGFLSGSIQASADDSLEKVTGKVVTGDKTGKSVKVKMGRPLPLDSNTLVVLAKRPAIRLSSPGIRPGPTAKLKLSFDTAGSKTVRVPIADGNSHEYSDVRPKSA